MFEQFLNLCRSCMKKDGKYNLFSTEFEAQPLERIIEKYSGSKISSKDQLPKLICQLCYDQLIATHIFVKNFIEVQKQLCSDIEQIEKATIQYDKKFILDTEDIKFDPASPSCAEELHELASTVKDENNEEEILIITFESQTLNVGTFCQGENIDEDLIKKQTDQKVKHEIATEVLHKKSNRKNKKYVCTGCDQSFIFMKNLREHCRSSGHGFIRRFGCNICLKKFLTRTHFKNHMRIHNKERPYKCDLCSVSFTFSSNLSRHKRIHEGKKAFFCNVCGKGFLEKHYLTTHMHKHNGEITYKSKNFYSKYGKTKVECKICKKIITRNALYNHMKVQHGDGSKKFLCNICGKSYSTKFYLDIHMNIHTKKKLYECELCSKSFTTHSYLAFHKVLHQGERPHSCELCGNTFKQKSHLNRHMKTHTGDKSHVCKFCEKAFALKENLKVHERIHTGEKPYLCSVCEQGFFSMSGRKKHEIRIHKKSELIKSL